MLHDLPRVVLLHAREESRATPLERERDGRLRQKGDGIVLMDARQRRRVRDGHGHLVRLRVGGQAPGRGQGQGQG